MVRRTDPEKRAQRHERAQTQSAGQLRYQRKQEIRELRTIREAHILLLLNHPNICQLKDLFSSNDHYYLVMEYVEGGQLMKYILLKQKLAEVEARRLSRQILSALDYLHRNSIVHRDLKVENILIDKEGKNIKIIDFGLSNMFSPERKLTTYCGSLYFAAPELLNARPYDGPEIDVWSFGVVLYVMVTGSVPFDDMSLPALHERIKRGQVAYPASLSIPLRNLLSRIFVTNPARRIILQDIIRHEWVNEGYKEIVDHHVPDRAPISGPLLDRILKQMHYGFNLGTTEEITTKMGLILNSDVYRKAAKHVALMRPACNNRSVRKLYKRPYDDPQTVPSAYHPLVALYHLSLERMISRGYDPDSNMELADDNYAEFFDNSRLSICSEGSLLQTLQEGVNFLQSLDQMENEEYERRRQEEIIEFNVRFNQDCRERARGLHANVSFYERYLAECRRRNGMLTNAIDSSYETDTDGSASGSDYFDSKYFRDYPADSMMAGDNATLTTASNSKAESSNSKSVSSNVKADFSKTGPSRMTQLKQGFALSLYVITLKASMFFDRLNCKR